MHGASLFGEEIGVVVLRTLPDTIEASFCERPELLEPPEVYKSTGSLDGLTEAQQMVTNRKCRSSNYCTELCLPCPCQLGDSC